MSRRVQQALAGVLLVIAVVAVLWQTFQPVPSVAVVVVALVVAFVAACWLSDLILRPYDWRQDGL